MWCAAADDAGADAEAVQAAGADADARAAAAQSRGRAAGASVCISSHCKLICCGGASHSWGVPLQRLWQGQANTPDGSPLIHTVPVSAHYAVQMEPFGSLIAFYLHLHGNACMARP
jgi:hypothetical protein